MWGVHSLQMSPKKFSKSSLYKIQCKRCMRGGVRYKADVRSGTAVAECLTVTCKFLRRFP